MILKSLTNENFKSAIYLTILYMLIFFVCILQWWILQNYICFKLIIVYIPQERYWLMDTAWLSPTLAPPTASFTNSTMSLFLLPLVLKLKTFKLYGWFLVFCGVQIRFILNNSLWNVVLCIDIWFTNHMPCSCIIMMIYYDIYMYNDNDNNNNDLSIILQIEKQRQNLFLLIT